VITDDWLELLRCCECGSPYELSDTMLCCQRCDARFPVVDGIPVLVKDTTIGTSLESIDYDAVHGITEQAVRNTGAQWNAIIEQLIPKPEHAVEIGAGTGVLTLGLADANAVQRLTAIDVSHKFLAMLAPRLAASPLPVSIVACDANEPHFRAEAFDLVMGRSILHHLVDYDTTLRHCHAILKPGGVAVFFEPVLEGKTVITLLLALMVRSDEVRSDPQFTSDERQRIRGVIRHQMKSKWYPQDREALSRLEDKYIFEIDEMKSVGRKAGFSDVDFLNNGDANPTYWPSIVRILRRVGVRQECIRRYRWVAEEFANTQGVMFPDKLVTPMGYFVFRK
jgi:ubiquinone/menaquinone biosynthesis C-methylase UbiE/uncharacterized protein YbaR (Trm112 family)